LKTKPCIIKTCISISRTLKATLKGQLSIEAIESFERFGCFLLACPSQIEALPTIPKNNSILELQGFLEHNDFASKSANKLKIAMLKCLT